MRADYSVEGDTIALTYSIAGRIFSIHFEKRRIYGDFWGSVLELDLAFDRWRERGFG